MFGKRILILVAHPDDEIVGFGASIGRARAEGAALSALYLTHGCLAQDAMWKWQRKNYQKNIARRQAEADQAATFLGLQPVGFSDRPARHIWREMLKVFREVSEAIDHYRPDQLWVPAYEGGNPDHDALNAIGFKCKTRLSVIEFSEYHFLNGRTHAHEFISAEPNMRIVTLTPEERKAKKKALKLYASEKKNLSYVGLKQESCRPLTGYDYAHRPHQGRLWYERFQWVPFCHPRVDFTRAEEVSEAIQAFLA